MPSLFSYRFEQLMHEKHGEEKTHCRLLAIKIFVDHFEQERAFYTSLFGCPPTRETDHSAEFPLLENISFVLVASPKKGANRIELEVETREILSSWQNMTRALFRNVSKMAVLKKELMFTALSPSGLLLRMRQKSAQQ